MLTCAAGLEYTVRIIHIDVFIDKRRFKFFYFLLKVHTLLCLHETYFPTHVFTFVVINALKTLHSAHAKVH